MWPISCGRFTAQASDGNHADTHAMGAGSSLQAKLVRQLENDRTQIAELQAKLQRQQDDLDEARLAIDAQRTEAVHATVDGKSHIELQQMLDDMHAARELKEVEDEAAREDRMAWHAFLFANRILQQDITRAWLAWHDFCLTGLHRRRLLAHATSRLAKPRLTSAIRFWRIQWQLAERAAADHAAATRAAVEAEVSTVRREMVVRESALSSLEERFDDTQQERIVHLEGTAVRRLRHLAMARAWQAWLDRRRRGKCDPLTQVAKSAKKWAKLMVQSELVDSDAQALRVAGAVVNRLDAQRLSLSSNVGVPIAGGDTSASRLQLRPAPSVNQLRVAAPGVRSMARSKSDIIGPRHRAPPSPPVRVMMATFPLTGLVENAQPHCTEAKLPSASSSESLLPPSPMPPAREPVDVPAAQPSSNAAADDDAEWRRRAERAERLSVKLGERLNSKVSVMAKQLAKAEAQATAKTILADGEMARIKMLERTLDIQRKQLNAQRHELHRAKTELAEKR